MITTTQNSISTEYLGRVIESCDPDVLCLQEVTLPILFVMQGQVWFEKYHLCAQPSEKELQLIKVFLRRAGEEERDD